MGCGAGRAAAVLPLPERLDLTRAEHTLSVRAQLVRCHGDAPPLLPVIGSFLRYRCLAHELRCGRVPV